MLFKADSVACKNAKWWMQINKHFENRTASDRFCGPPHYHCANRSLLMPYANPYLLPSVFSTHVEAGAILPGPVVEVGDLPKSDAQPRHRTTLEPRARRSSLLLIHLNSGARAANSWIKNCSFGVGGVGSWCYFVRLNSSAENRKWKRLIKGASYDFSLKKIHRAEESNPSCSKYLC